MDLLVAAELAPWAAHTPPSTTAHGWPERWVQERLDEVVAALADLGQESGTT